MTVQRRIFWRRLDGAGLEQATVRIGCDGGGASGVSVAVVDGEGFAVRWHVVWDGHWRTRAVRVERLDRPPLLLDVAVDDAAVWRDAGGRELEALRGCLDADIACTPFTNTLAIRRLGLAQGDAGDIQVAYFGVPSLTAEPSPQRYARIGADRWRFEALDTDFTAVLRVDDEALVVAYEGLFARVDEPVTTAAVSP